MTFAFVPLLRVAALFDDAAREIAKAAGLCAWCVGTGIRGRITSMAYFTWIEEEPCDKCALGAKVEKELSDRAKAGARYKVHEFYWSLSAGGPS